MTEMIAFMAAPFFASLTIAAIHVYLGIHILQREVIFVDLALAQIAALGTTVAFIAGVSLDSSLSYVFSFGFVVLGSALFAVTRVRHQKIPQEAIIGITYVVATAASILVADRAAGGAEHIKEMLTGAVLWVRWPAILQLAGVYAAITVVHILFRGKFTGLTQRYREGLLEPGDRWWDFLFYLTFGIVIVMSVRIAGILLVFSFLVVPSSVSLLFSGGWRGRMYVGWTVATVAALLGMFASYGLNMPCGPAIVVILGLMLGVIALVRLLLFARSPQGGSSG
ncbi:MAG: metal ABC transporter permease [bacterium]